MIILKYFRISPNPRVPLTETTIKALMRKLQLLITFSFVLVRFGHLSKERKFHTKVLDAS